MNLVIGLDSVNFHYHYYDRIKRDLVLHQQIFCAPSRALQGRAGMKHPSHRRTSVAPRGERRFKRQATLEMEGVTGCQLVKRRLDLAPDRIVSRPRDLLKRCGDFGLVSMSPGTGPS